MQTTNQTSIGKEWQRAVELEHAQSDRLREDQDDGDFWKPVAHRFTPPSKEEAGNDDTVVQLANLISSNETVLDVGAGAGRIALPIADHAKHVTAVEPSEGMRERMIQTAEAWGISNLSIIDSEWQRTEVEPHDLVVCAHVVYTVQDIEFFVQKLSANAKKHVALISFKRPAMAQYLPLWDSVHGEVRIALPSLTEIEQLLHALDIDYEKIPLDPWISRPFKTIEQAQTESEARLFISPGSEKSQILSSVLEDSLVEVDGGYRFKWSEPHRPFIVLWNTG